MDSDGKRTVQAGRRRKTSQPGPEGRERAEAPQRQQPGGGGGGAGGTGLPGFPSGGRRPPSLVGVIIVVGALSFLPALALGPIVEHLMMAG